MINLLDGEKIILTGRRHWFVITVSGISLFFIMIAPFAGLFAFYKFFPELSYFLQNYWALIIFYGAVWTQIFWMFFFVNWTNYYLDMFLVTNKRIIEIDQIGLFKRDIAELRLENIQDVKIQVLGFVPSLLKMGSVHIQTAGQNKEVLLENIRKPYETKDIISACRDKILKENPHSAPEKV